MLKLLKLKLKLLQTNRILNSAFSRFPAEKMALAFTGGKDSTLLLWIMKKFCLKKGLTLPIIFFIDEGDTFPEVEEFVRKISQKWRVKIIHIANNNILKQIKRKGDKVYVKDLNRRNKEELKRICFEEKSFLFDPESLVGNHLMKTVPLNEFIEKEKIQAVITGIRRDENEARSNESFFSPRDNPPHTRIHPILHLTEEDVWNVILRNKITVVKLYAQGYRSLGTKSGTQKPSDTPAWLQNRKKIKERTGRSQDKEKIMKKLRSLGYM